MSTGPVPSPQQRRQGRGMLAAAAAVMLALGGLPPRVRPSRPGRPSPATCWT
ncbi:hypothetical protein [Kitasatospora sp. Root107]|uniref:hypothetical protein n=1 Tax=Kitasatospora sp. Root107 TaxID=1736424 RepID=UPI000A90E171|nr:hypothetical protein [Kitasatospora sp. Root107]